MHCRTGSPMAAVIRGSRLEARRYPLRSRAVARRVRRPWRSAVCRLAARQAPGGGNLRPRRQIADGLTSIEEAIDHSERLEERWLTAELLRVKGELLLLQGDTGSAEAAQITSAGARLGAAARRALLGVARRHELRPADARSRPVSRRAGNSPTRLQPVYRRVWDCRPEVGKSAARYSALGAVGPLATQPDQRRFGRQTRRPIRRSKVKPEIC